MTDRLHGKTDPEAAKERQSLFKVEIMMKRRLALLLPSEFFYADQLTVSAKRLLVRIAVGLGGLIAGAFAIGLVGLHNWQDVVAGALFAWGISVIAWSISSYRSGRNALREVVRRTAEVDLLHARLNQIALRVGAPVLDLDIQLEKAITERSERLAHFAGLDEFREEFGSSKVKESFWDLDALGRP